MRSLVAGVGAVALLSAAIPALAAPSDQLKAHLTFTGEAKGDASGHQIEIADLDGDRIGDLVIGAWHNDSGGTDSGAVYIEYGPLNKSRNLAHADVKLFTPVAGEYVGEGPLGIADLNGDGADELVIGAPGSFYAAQPGSPGKVGEAFLLYGGDRLRGKLELPDVANARFTGVHITEWLGFGSSGVGDLDDDGIEDLLIGAPATAGFTGAGYLFYGSKQRLEGDVAVTAADAILTGQRAGEMFGYEAAGGDVDDDGDDDLFVVSKPLAGGPANISMFLGGARMSGVVPGVTAYSQFPVGSVDYFAGPVLASGADVTGDRVDDLVVGVAPNLNPVDQRATYILGGSSSAFTQGPQVQTRTNIGGSGDAVAIGDVNGDGKADLITSSTGAGVGGTVYVFYGRFAAPSISNDEVIAVNPPDALDQIHVGDARHMPQILDSSVALVVTSPPYFAGKEYETALGEGGVPASYRDYLQMLTEVFAECVRKLEPGGRIAINVANLGRRPYRSLAADVITILQDDLKLLLRGEVVWVKGSGASGSTAWGSFQSPANPVLRDLSERVVIASKGRFDRAVSRKQREQQGLPSEVSIFKDDFMEATTDVWELASESAKRVKHPAPFPVELPLRLIELYTYRGDVVLDPFIGSGSTAVAAVRSERRFVGYDTDPEYVETARARVKAEMSHSGSAVAQRARVARRAGVDLAETDELSSATAVRAGRSAKEIARAVLAES
ncbi:MAG: FG-GAP-like repeat-containing protein, partial [Actinobacteria bacterium]|nr:FG-GAP-like repeat-containing protein [Actinomycetota bacterium]